jgi:hypothetical protein
MADVELLDFGDCRDRPNVAGGEPVSRVDGETHQVALARCVLQRTKHGCLVRVVRVAASVQLDGHGAEVARARYDVSVGIDEEARANSNRCQLPYGGPQCLRVARHVQASFGRHLLASLRDERDLVGAQAARDPDHLRGAGHFEVEDRPDCSLQPLYVVVLDVATILAQVSRDAVCPCILTFDRRENGIRFDGATCLAKRRNVVDVNVKSLVHGRLSYHSGPQRRGENPVKRTILLLSLVVAGCKSGSGSSSAPTAAAAPAANLPGAAAPRGAVERFLAAAKSQDLQELSIAWGTSKGPARDQFERTELEKRLIVMQGCYDADKFTIGDEQPGDNGKRIMKVDLTKGPVTKSPRFTTVKGPSDRWYVEDADFGAVTALCRQK